MNVEFKIGDLIIVKDVDTNEMKLASKIKTIFTTFNKVEYGNYLIITGGLGISAGFEKIEPTDKGNALCINSSNGTYQKGTIYFIQESQEVFSYE